MVGFVLASMYLDLYLKQAWADYMAYRENKWDKDPFFCILKPTYYKELKSYGVSMGSMLQGVNIWKQELNQNFEPNWNYTVKIYPTFTAMLEADCDVKIAFEDKSLGPIGTTDCYVLKETERQYCDIMIYTGSVPVKFIKSTVTHEVGHALGLGHRLPYTKCDFAAVVVSGDIMMAQASVNQHITDDDLKALLELYGADGFTLPNPTTENKYRITEKPLKCA